MVDAKYSTLVGTPDQLEALIRLLTGGGTSVVDLKFSRFIVLKKSIAHTAIVKALDGTRQRSAKVSK